MTISVNLVESPVAVTVDASGGSVSVTAATVTGVSVGVGDFVAPAPHAGTHLLGGSDEFGIGAIAQTQVASFFGNDHLGDDINYLNTGKAATSHAHTWSQITGKPSAFTPDLNGEQTFTADNATTTTINGGSVSVWSIAFNTTGAFVTQTYPYTTAERSKLASIASSATANATNAQLRDRATHTGTQGSTTIVTTSNGIGFDEIDSFVDEVLYNGYSSALENVLGGAPLYHGGNHGPGGVDQATLCETRIFTRSSKPADASGSNGSYTWTVPATAKFITLDVTGAGGGGGSGRRGAAGTVRGGGGGGGAGGRTIYEFPCSELSSRGLTISVGAGGGGGAAVTANDTNGNNGSAGGNSQIQITNSGAVLAFAWSGSGGDGGTTSGGSGGYANWVSTYTGITGGNGGGSTPAGSAPGFGVQGAQGGGGGGGISAADGTGAGGSGYSREITRNLQAGPAGGTAGGGAGSAGLTAQAGGSGGGGSGGGSSVNSAGGSGGAGGAYGGGGGGGGASVNGFNSGAGGNGGDGVVRITVWY